MITSFEARWFRPFEHIEVNDLRGLNILVGRSASGKTALLEGIRLALAGTPHVAANLNAARGLWFIQQNPSREQFESIWAPLFFAFDTKGKIEASPPLVYLSMAPHRPGPLCRFLRLIR
jgi:hypothetical protein